MLRSIDILGSMFQPRYHLHARCNKSSIESNRSILACNTYPRIRSDQHTRLKFAPSRPALFRIYVLAKLCLPGSYQPRSPQTSRFVQQGETFESKSPGDASERRLFLQAILLRNDFAADLQSPLNGDFPDIRRRPHYPLIVEYDVAWSLR